MEICGAYQCITTMKMKYSTDKGFRILHGGRHVERDDYSGSNKETKEREMNMWMISALHSEGTWTAV